MISSSFNYPKNSVKPVFDLLACPIINNLTPIKPLTLCPICYSYYLQSFRPNSCTHLFCRKYITKWKKTKKQCPICRSKFSYIIKVLL